ncbi:TetR/AcrR family transcriptional regulator [Saccharopolyspora sp. TS4A08]|uniref:TetR/AcrR family transcriptional regulator n=1 Tax=Saccharopolyspora ipomoeae TaxID=3042027 RepID=A0ABT6PWI4_9PSEU|nr:TetR/AcrR family transcriptional regulator [Saccharopolyspora sp. TS4A08]MDI2032242.1 TetR/AcrR family transcriptional regulator [Saccharopolyspora sp. TS4A08]
MAVDRNQILNAAASLLARRSTAPMDEVARAAGISRATLNRHFAGRDALVLALQELGIARCEEALDAARLEDGSTEEALRRGIQELAPSADLINFLYCESQLFEPEHHHEGWDRIDARLTEFFRLGQQRGDLRIDLSPAWLTEALYGLLGSAAWAITDGRLARKDFTFMVSELLLGGARKQGS